MFDQSHLMDSLLGSSSIEKSLVCCTKFQFGYFISFLVGQQHLSILVTIFENYVATAKNSGGELYSTAGSIMQRHQVGIWNSPSSIGSSHRSAEGPLCAFNFEYICHLHYFL